MKFVISFFSVFFCCSTAFAASGSALLTPILECTAKSGAESYRSYFGYLNSGTSVIPLPVSASNTFNPAPANRGQPTSFQVGRVSNVFSVLHSGSAFSWFLLGKSANASSSGAERCQSTCSVPAKVTISACQTAVAISGSNSSTLNNNQSFSSVSWTTNCPGTFSPTNALSTTFTLNSLYTGPKFSCSATLNLTDDTRYGSQDQRELQLRNCATEVVVEQCQVDCKGTPFGTVNIDACGVCGGDGSSCKDCKGVIGGTSKIDQCNVCGGDGSTCKDCKGVVNGTSKVDSCNVCGGNSSTCSDCAGIPNGKAVLDKCGVCGGNGSTCGVTVTRLDDCGVANGDNSTCKDCAGVSNGTAKADACGVCGGDGSSCASCANVTSQELLKSDFTSLVRGLQKSARTYIGEASRCSKKSKKIMTTYLKQTETLASSTISLAQQSFVEPAPGCLGVSTCTLTVSLESVKLTLETNIKQIRDLTKAGKLVVAKCRKPIKGTATGSRELLSQTLSSLKSLPNQCKISCPK